MRLFSLTLTFLVLTAAGTYRIPNTVRTTRKAHTDGVGIALLGEGPGTTILRWDGPEGGLMLHYDAWCSRIGHLTLGGAGKDAAAVELRR